MSSYVIDWLLGWLYNQVMVIERAGQDRKMQDQDELDLTEEEATAEYEAQVLADIHNELLQQDPVYQECGFVSFVSRSKGRRKDGSRRYRRNWKEVELYRRSNGFHLPQNFPFDEEATELIDRDDAEALQDHMKEVCRTT